MKVGSVWRVGLPWRPMAWDVEGFVTSLAGRSEHTRRAYEHFGRVPPEGTPGQKKLF